MSDGLRREMRRIVTVGDWLDWRKAHITASRMGALFDAHPYLTREQMAGELRGQSTKGDTPSMRRGRVLEAAVIEALREEHPGWRIERCRSYHWLPEHRIGATPDAWLDDDGLIEVKTVRPEIWDRWHGHPPVGYLLQLLTGMMCTDRRHGVLACMVLSPDYPVHEFAVLRHPAAEQKILDAVAAWWRDWDEGRIADAAPAEELAALLDDGSHLDLSGNAEIRELLEERRGLKERHGDDERRLKDIEYVLKNTLAAASTAWLPGYQISFRRTHRKEHVVPAADIRVLRVRELTEEQDVE